ncbi:thioesterase domain-containing protein [Streptomyces sp. NPDC005571]|uniref:thioesterase II family protein n=1 Tax=Streptomyces sp. NPDC005571 TaxID=3156888 RepID=UPI0033AE798F
MTVKSAWLPRPPSATAAGRIICLPHAGGSAAIFAAWPEARGSVEFLPVEPPGRLGRFGEPVPDTFQELAADLIDGLAGCLDVPFAIFGHCWSALLAYEMAAQLQGAGRPGPVRLFVSSQVAPQDGPVGRMLGMDDTELARDLSETIREAGNEPHPELVSFYAQVLRTDVEISRRYQVGAPVRLDCPVTAVGWADDTEVRPEQMANWADCGETSFEVFPGRHHRFLDAPEPLLRTLCAAFPAGLDRS